MKYYETSFDDYTSSVENNNIHPELEPIYKCLPQNIHNFENTLVYGPPGTGKYSQILSIIRRYSPSQLKYDKKLTANTEKQSYIYHISDIHYEIDMSLLGCNSKTLWSEIFFQIVDIISMKSDKIGIILCKKFHLIHSELLEIFYSYMQQYNHSNTHIFIKFVLITENISFIPSNIINVCQVLRVQRPTIDKYMEITKQSTDTTSFLNRIIDKTVKNTEPQQTRKILSQIKLSNITNIKEINALELINMNDIPSDIFNIVCDKIITTIESIETFNYLEFRDDLYNILTYNLDVAECIWYIFTHFIYKEILKPEDISEIIEKTYLFFKYYNNNYRPIYHLESIMFYIINKIQKYDEL